MINEIDNETVRKIAAEQMAQLRQQQCGSMAPDPSAYSQGCCNTSEKVASPSLTDRVRTQGRRSEQEAIRAGKLKELEYLLDKNPETARILDLLEVVKS
jgi:hypothetical protein